MLFAMSLKGRGGAAGVSTLEATQLMNHKNAVVVDVRSDDEYARGSITGARHIPVDALAARVGELARFKGRPVIVVCQSGGRSARAVAQLGKEGFAEVYNLTGGLAAWQAAGLPVTRAAKDAAGAAAGSNPVNRKEKS